MAEAGAEDRERRRAWLMLAAGTLAAWAEAWTVCARLRPVAHHAWPGSIFWSVLSIGICVSGGVVTAWVAGWLAGERKPAIALLMGATVGWVFLPCITLMVIRGSWLALPVTALAVTAATFRLRPLLRKDAGDAQGEPQAVGNWQSLQGLPTTGAPPMRSFGIAVGLQAWVVLAAAGWLGDASVVLGVCLAVLIVWGTAWNGRWARMWAGRRRVAQLYAAAVLLTLMLTPWIMGSGGGSGVAAAGSAKGAGREAEPGSGGTDWVGIVLWPPPKKKVDLVPPKAHSPMAGPGVGSKPLVIPFDGPYWYFKAPAVGPGRAAHVAFGKPTEAHVRSTDRLPLRMEAHQNLGVPIDLDCCREIDVTVTNADVGVGTIEVSLVLVDTSGKLRRTMMLGMEPVASSELGQAHADQPVSETLKFMVPRAMAIARFDEIDVVIQPTWTRAKLGSRVGVEQFELVPR